MAFTLVQKILGFLLINSAAFVLMTMSLEDAGYFWIYWVS
jgi:hypothetical protein